MWIAGRDHKPKERFGWEVLSKEDRKKVELGLILLHVCTILEFESVMRNWVGLMMMVGT